MFSQQPDQKNLLAAIVLSMGVLLLWQYFYATPKLKQEQERQAILKQQQPGLQAPGTPPAGGTTTDGTTPVAGQPVTPAAPGTVAAPGAAPAAATLSRDDALKASPRVAIETNALRGSISLRGGRIDDLQLAKYRETVKPDSPNVHLFSPSGGPDAYYAEKGWVPAPGIDQKMPDINTVWTAETMGALTPTSPLVLSWNNDQGLQFRRTIKLDDNYMFTINDEIENKTGRDVTLYPFALISRHGKP